jgi:hypothetical protein
MYNKKKYITTIFFTDYRIVEKSAKNFYHSVDFEPCARPIRPRALPIPAPRYELVATVNTAYLRGAKYF